MFRLLCSFAVAVRRPIPRVDTVRRAAAAVLTQTPRRLPDRLRVRARRTIGQARWRLGAGVHPQKWGQWHHPICAPGTWGDRSGVRIAAATDRGGEPWINEDGQARSVCHTLAYC